eukprot:c45627_g1_i1 orf=2-181(-)
MPLLPDQLCFQAYWNSDMTTRASFSEKLSGASFEGGFITVRSPIVYPIATSLRSTACSVS